MTANWIGLGRSHVAVLKEDGRVAAIGKNDTKEILTNFITKLEDLNGEQTEFREELWGGLDSSPLGDGP